MARPVPFGLVTTRTEARAVVKVVGELDAATAPRLDEELVRLTGAGTSRITLDLAEVSFISSPGLSVLDAGRRHLREKGGDLALQAPTPMTMKVLEMTGMTGVFAITAQGDSR